MYQHLCVYIYYYMVMYTIHIYMHIYIYIIYPCLEQHSELKRHFLISFRELSL